MASVPAQNPPQKMFCGECGGSFAVEDLARFGNSYVCPNCKPAFVQRMREGAQPIGSSMGAVRYGGFWIRFVAVFIDGLIMSVVIVPIMLAVMFAGGGFNASNPQNPPNVGWRQMTDEERDKFKEEWRRRWHKRP